MQAQGGVGVAWHIGPAQVLRCQAHAAQQHGVRRAAGCAGVIKLKRRCVDAQIAQLGAPVRRGRRRRRSVDRPVRRGYQPLLHVQQPCRIAPQLGLRAGHTHGADAGAAREQIELEVVDVQPRGLQRRPLRRGLDDAQGVELHRLERQREGR